MSRKRLPNRRHAETFNFEVASLCYTATIGRFADGGLAEIFLTNCKSGSQADSNARDAAVVCSIALQHGVPVETIRHALMRDARGRATGPLGVALDMLLNEEPGPQPRSN